MYGLCSTMHNTIERANEVLGTNHVTSPVAGRVGLGADVDALFLEGDPSYRVGNKDARYAS